VKNDAELAPAATTTRSPPYSRQRQSNAQSPVLRRWSAAARHYIERGGNGPQGRRPRRRPEAIQPRLSARVIGVSRTSPIPYKWFTLRPAQGDAMPAGARRRPQASRSASLAGPSFYPTFSTDRSPTSRHVGDPPAAACTVVRMHSPKSSTAAVRTKKSASGAH